MGGAADVGRWPTRKYKKYRAYLLWLRKVEAGSYQQPDEEDDGTPKWWAEGPEDTPSWETESFQRL